MPTLDPFLDLHLRLNPAKTSLELQEAVQSERELLVFDGIEWLLSIKNRQTLIFVESDLSKIHAAKELPEFQELLQRENVYLCYQDVFPCFTGGKSIEVFSLELRPLFVKIVQDVIRFESLYLEGQDLGVGHFKNVIDTLLTLKECTPISALRGDFARSWLIVGAAPLTQDEEALIHAAKDTHLICSAGSATKMLLEKNIRPDFATFVDPNPDPDQYVRHDVPTFFQLRAHTKILQEKNGPLIWAGFNNLYPLELDFIEAACLPYILLDGGYDTLNLAVAIASYLGALSIEYAGVSEGRGTLNDILSRLELAEKKRCERTFTEGMVQISHEKVADLCENIFDAEDEWDLARWGVVDGYIRPLKIFTGKESIALDALKNLVKNRKNREIKG